MSLSAMMGTDRRYTREDDLFGVRTSSSEARLPGSHVMPDLEWRVQSVYCRSKASKRFGDQSGTCCIVSGILALPADSQALQTTEGLSYDPILRSFNSTTDRA